MISSTILLKLPVCYSYSVSMKVILSRIILNTLTCVDRITEMMSADPFVAGLKSSGGICFAIAIHLISLHNIL